MMVQIVEHRAETSVDFLMEEEAASSTPLVANRPVPDTAAVHVAQQHTAAQTSLTLLGWKAEAKLEEVLASAWKWQQKLRADGIM